MKHFTMIFSVLLVALFVGTLVFVGMSPEFTAPISLIGEGEDPDAPVWDMTMDDLLAYLVEKGFIASVDDPNKLAAGVATVARVFDGAEVYWWDIENLEPDSAEEIAYKSMKAEGIIDVYGSGHIMAIQGNGPFGIAVTYYKRDADALVKAFQEFGKSR